MNDADFVNDTGEGRGVKILAVASGGGHWEQLMLLRDVLERFDVTFVTTNAALAHRANLAKVHLIPDCNRDTPLSSLKSFLSAFLVAMRERPDVVITTGALPGLFCLFAARFIGARAVWLDSVANVEKLSSSGCVAKSFASLCLTQWRHLAKDGVQYAGSVL